MKSPLHLVLFLSVILVLPIIANGQRPDGPTVFEAHQYHNGNGDTLNYRLLKPAKYDTSKSYPVVLFMHGAGERGDDNISQLKWGAYRFEKNHLRKNYPAFVVAPQVPKGEYWSNYRDADTLSYSNPMDSFPTRSMKLTIRLLGELQKRFAIDSFRIYVTGLSMGGFGAWEIIQRYPDKFAAAVPICGGGDRSRGFMLTKLPIWAFHGAVDEVVDPKYSRTMIDAIQIAGGNPGFTEYPYTGHIQSWVKTYSNPLLYKWLFNQSKAAKKRKK